MKKILTILLIITAMPLLLQGSVTSNYLEESTTQGILKGVVTDKNSGESVIGATVFFPDLNIGVASNLDGFYTLAGVPIGVHKVQISSIGYQTVEIHELEIKSGENRFDVLIEESSNLLDEIVVTSVKRMSSQIAMVQSVRNARAMVSGMSGIQISRSQDRTAAEVVRRIPGVSLIDERLIVVRGLPGRYNNVWINNTAVPSTEADSRNFSFDLLPSSQLESIMVVKSQSADLPADFAGGFVKIATGSMPDENAFKISVGTGINPATHFKEYLINSGSSTDFLGFDSGERKISSFIPRRVNNNDLEMVDKLIKEGFREEWSLDTRDALPNLSLSLLAQKSINNSKGAFGITAAANYTKSTLVYRDMQNSRFGVYNTVEDKPEYIYKYNDHQYNSDVRGGAMINLAWMGNRDKIEWRTIFNILGKNRYTVRDGWQNVSALYLQEKYEYIYSSRSTLTTQLSGRHDRTNGFGEWSISYSSAKMDQPDRRIINREENRIVGDEHFGKMAIDQNQITRDFVTLDENIATAAMSYTLDLSKGGPTEAELVTGLLGEYRGRDYSNREFFYRYRTGSLPQDFIYRDPVSEILTFQNYGWDKLYAYEDTDNRNSYKGRNYNGAAYAMLNLTKGKLNLNAGLRFEAQRMTLTSYDKIYEFDTFDTDYDIIGLYPSLNAFYNFDKKNIIRFSYGKSINKQEFREVSASVYYDFNLFSDVKGNPNLKHAQINNVDLRFEHYPSIGEYITLALFYKHFENPIEWTYLDAGGSYTYTFENAESARNIGIEADIRLGLEYIGLNNFSIGLNTAWIESRVSFDSERSLEKDRAMQGQSPYLINSSLYYDNNSIGLSAGVMYNRIGKRIVGIGRADTGSGASINNDVPDTYELPRDILDFVISKKIGSSMLLRFKASDILNQSVIFKQYPKFIDGNGKVSGREQISKSFKVGSYFSIAIEISL